MEGMEIHVHELGKAYFIMLQKAKFILSNKLLLDCDNASIHEETILKMKDNWNPNCEKGSFINILRDKQENKYQLTRYLSSKGFLNSEKNDWDNNKLRRWMNEVSDFMDLLSCLIHISGGQPARATELCSYQLVTTKNQHRGVFLLNGQILLSQNYHKSLSMTVCHKNIQRLLPFDLSKLLIDYLVFVRPFEM